MWSWSPVATWPTGRTPCRRSTTLPSPVGHLRAQQPHESPYAQPPRHSQHHAKHPRVSLGKKDAVACVLELRDRHLIGDGGCPTGPDLLEPQQVEVAR